MIYNKNRSSTLHSSIQQNPCTPDSDQWVHEEAEVDFNDDLSLTSLADTPSPLPPRHYSLRRIDAEIADPSCY